MVPRPRHVVCPSDHRGRVRPGMPCPRRWRTRTLENFADLAELPARRARQHTGQPARSLPALRRHAHGHAVRAGRRSRPGPAGPASYPCRPASAARPAGQLRPVQPAASPHHRASTCSRPDRGAPSSLAVAGHVPSGTGVFSHTKGQNSCGSEAFCFSSLSFF